MEKLSDMSGRNISRVQESRNSGGLGVGDLLSTKKHEPLDASHGVQIIAKKFKQENERLKEEVAILKAQCNAKDEKIAHFEEIVSANNKEIADLKEKLSELQQNREETEVDFAKQLKATDEKLRKIPYKEQLFNAKDYFDPQPSWFDTLLPSNIKCLEINNYPVRANDLDAKNTDGSSHKSWKPKQPEAAKAKDCFDLQPSWFDTLLPSNIGCLEINNYPVRANNLDAKNTGGSSDKSWKPKHSEAGKGKVRKLQHPPPPLFIPVKAAVKPPAGQKRPPLGRTVKAKVVEGTPTAMPVNPFSKAAKGNGYIHQRPLPFVPVTTVLDGSKMANTYPANAFAQSVTPFPHIEQQGFLRRTFNKWFGY